MSEQAACLSAKIDPKQEFLAFLSQEGTLTIYKMPSEESEGAMEVCKKIEGLAKGPLEWSLDGENLYIGGKENLTAVKRSSWIRMNLQEIKHKQAIKFVAHVSGDLLMT